VKGCAKASEVPINSNSKLMKYRRMASLLIMRIPPGNDFF
jgi:hypothetical protein